MTLSSSLSISVSGLLAQSSAITGISGDLANTSSTGYKATDTSFSDLVSTYSSSKDSGLNGVSASVKYNNDFQGTIAATNATTDLAINGNGFFAVQTATRNADGTLTFSTETYYTRAGDFSMDATGYYKNSAGYYLCGRSVDPITGVVTPGAPIPVRISPDETNAAIATTEIYYTANLPAGTATTAASSVPVYDSAGTAHNVTYSWVLADASTNTWTLTVTAPDGIYDAGTDTSSPYTASIPVSFDTSGNVDTVGAGVGYTVAGTTISFGLSYEGADAQTISSNLSRLTQYADTAITVESFTANGVDDGSYKNTNIDSSGNVSVMYTNGQFVTYYKIPIATFVASDNLALLTGTAYQATLASGAVTYSDAGTYGAGTILSYSLEESTVDIASELTDMIQSQQVYSANAKVVTAVDEMMKTLVGIQ